MSDEPRTPPVAGDGAGAADERVRGRRSWQQALSHPAAGAVITTLIALLVFTWPIWDCLTDAHACFAQGFLTPRGIANWLEVAAQVGILAAAVSLLMIAGEFDLSIGSMIGAAGMVLALGMSQFGLDPWMAVAVAFAFALAVGFFNGWLVTRTGLPSFIVTLGMLFLLRGLTIGITRLITGRTQVGGLARSPTATPCAALRRRHLLFRDFQIAASVFWWLAGHGGGLVRPHAHDVRQLDLRDRRQPDASAQRRRAGPTASRSPSSWPRPPRPPCWPASRSSPWLGRRSEASRRSSRPSPLRSSAGRC